MSSKSRPRFDPDALRDLAGKAVFTRGEAYFRDGMVAILGAEPSRIIARVAGTEDYRTVVTGHGSAIDGECSCPAFDREGICKHMVAVALAANAAPASGEPDGGGTLTRVRDHLMTWTVGALAATIMDIAERDPTLLRKLEIGAAAAGADDKTLESLLRRAIRDATRTRGFVDYRRAPEWAAGVDAMLDALEQLASGPRAALVIELAVHAITRIEHAIDNIDDSDGYCTGLLTHAQGIHLAACRTAGPNPVALARDLFQRESEGAYDTFHGAAAQYADVLGKEGLAEYRRLAQDAWDGLPARIGPRNGRQDYISDDFGLMGTLEFFAERDGDVDTRIALRAKNLSSPWAYLQIAEFCQAHGREEEALRRVEEGLWLFEDDQPDERLVFFAVDLLQKADRMADAESYLWRAFEKAPSLSLFGRIRALGGQAAAQRALDHLQHQLVKVSSTRRQSPADLIVRIMIEEKQFDPAWAAVRAHGASPHVKEALARASEATHAAEALAVYAERVDALARVGGNLGYEEAIALIARMRALRGAAEHAAYLEEVKARHGRKRNFMKLLG
jgi:tetratricopeptide (TPR) repeat protein